MMKLLINALVIGAFALAGTNGFAQPQPRACSNAPKNYIPCPPMPLTPQQPKG